MQAHRSTGYNSSSKPYIPYAMYLRTPHWYRVRKRYYASTLPKECRICGATQGLNLHHRRYDVLWHEDIARDVVLICKRCHRDIHFHGFRKTPLTYVDLTAREAILYKKHHGLGLWDKVILILKVGVIGGGIVGSFFIH